MGLFIYLFAIIPMAFFTAWLGAEKGRSGFLWFVLGLFFPVLALLAVGLGPEKD